MCFFSAPKPPKMDKIEGKVAGAEMDKARRRLLMAAGKDSTVTNVGGKVGLVGSSASYSPQLGSGGTTNNG